MIRSMRCPLLGTVCCLGSLVHRSLLPIGVHTYHDLLHWFCPWSVDLSGVTQTIRLDSHGQQKKKFSDPKILAMHSQPVLHYLRWYTLTPRW